MPAATALASLQRLIDLAPHGADPPAHRADPGPCGVRAGRRATPRRATGQRAGRFGLVRRAQDLRPHPDDRRRASPSPKPEPCPPEPAWLAGDRRSRGCSAGLPTCSPPNWWSQCCATGPSSPGKATLMPAAEHVPVSPVSSTCRNRAPGLHPRLGEPTVCLHRLFNEQACGTHAARALATQRPAGSKPSLTCVGRSGRRESNPHDQLGRLALPLSYARVPRWRGPFKRRRVARHHG